MYKSLCVLAVALLGFACADHGVLEHTIEISNVPHNLPLTIPKSWITDLRREVEAVGGVNDGIVAIVNDYADKILTNVQNLMVTKGFDPMQLPDVRTGFWKVILFINYTGEISLTKGWLQDAATVYRGGDAVVTYHPSTHKLEVSVPLAFKDLMFNFDYSATFMHLGPRGGVEGKVSKVKIDFVLGIDFAGYNASIEEFNIDRGHIDLKFTGNFLVDWIVNLFTDVVTFVLNPLIIGIVSGIIRSGLEAVVNEINAILGWILNPTTAAPLTTTVATIFA